MGIQLVSCNYLDDFLFLHKFSEECDRLVRIFLHICENIGVPVAMEKTEWSDNLIVFLGLLLDGEQILDKCSRRKEN